MPGPSDGMLDAEIGIANMAQPSRQIRTEVVEESRSWGDTLSGSSYPPLVNADREDELVIRCPRAGDRELNAIALIREAIRYLPRDAKLRVLAYALDRYSPRQDTEHEFDERED